MGDGVVEDVQSLLRQWCIVAPQFKEIVEIGSARGLEIAYPKTKSRDRTKCKAVIAMNYYPLRHDGRQPCINKLVIIMHKILVVALGFSPEAALELTDDSVVYVNQSPFILDYLSVESDKGGYNKLLSLTDGPMTEMFAQVFTKERFPELKAAIVLGGSAYPFFSLLFSDLVNQEGPSPHPQPLLNNQATTEQRHRTVADFTAFLSLATGREPEEQLTQADLNDIF